MEFWKDENEPITMFLKMFEETSKIEDIAKGLRKVNQLIWFDYTQDGPNCSFWVDCRGEEIKAGQGKPDEEPNLTMSLSADDAHRAWSNKLNAVMAITRGKIKLKGSATGLLKLAPKSKKTAEVYVKVLKDMGKEDIIL